MQDHVHFQVINRLGKKNTLLKCYVKSKLKHYYLGWSEKLELKATTCICLHPLPPALYGLTMMKIMVFFSWERVKQIF